MTDSQKAEILQRAKRGENHRAIAASFGVDVKMIRAIVRTDQISHSGKMVARDVVREVVRQAKEQ